MEKRDFRLDLMRAILAFMVLSEHLRHCIFLNFAEQQQLSLSLYDTLFFGLSSLGKQAVVGFFCLSGYFVAFSLKSLMQTGKPFLAIFKVYALKRLTRIYTLFLPLLFAAIPIYYFSLYCNPELKSTLSSFGFGGAFLGDSTNISAFIPTLLLSPGLFGKGVWEGFSISWSLVNEVWYYLSAFIFALLLILLKKKTANLASLLFSVAILLALLRFHETLGILNYFPYFLVAFFVGWLKCSRLSTAPSRSDKASPWRGTASLFAIIIAPFVFIFAEKLFPAFQDSIVAFWVVCILFVTPGVAVAPKPKSSIFLASWARNLSNHSYSLYLSHSLLVIGFFGAFKFNRLPVGVTSYSLFAIFVVIAYLLAWILFRLIDSRHYQICRAFLGAKG